MSGGIYRFFGHGREVFKQKPEYYQKNARRLQKGQHYMVACREQVDTE